MPEFEKDFILRQTKELAKGLGKFLEQDSVDEILQYEQETSQSKDKEKESKKETQQKK
jgi:hypothetical protein